MPMLRRPVLMALALVVLLAWTVSDAQGPGESGPAVEELAMRVDPARDDWRSESLQAEAGRRLEELAAILGRGDTPDKAAGIFTPEARSTPLRPDGPDRLRVAGGLEIARRAASEANAEPSLTVAAALAGLTTPIRGGDSRFKFKIVGIDVTEAGAPTTAVRYEAAGRKPGGVVQQVALWEVPGPARRKERRGSRPYGSTPSRR